MPTFLYRAGAVQVEESPSADYRQSGGCLIRGFRFTSGEEVNNLYFRVAAGKKIREKGTVFTVDDRLTYRIKAAAESKPQVRTVDGQEELIVSIVFGPPGSDKQRETKLDVDLTWNTNPR